MIVARHMFAHNANPDDIFDGIDALLHENGVVLIENQYAFETLQTGAFDQIYHEHMFYYSVKNMKNYIVTHTFKSKEAKAKMIEVTGSMSMEDMTKAMTSDNAKCQMSWNTPGDNLTMYCWWKGTNPDAINKQLESMNDFYEPHKFVECTDDVIDFNAK